MTTKITDADALAVMDKAIARRDIVLADMIEARAHIAARLAAGGVLGFMCVDSGRVTVVDEHHWPNTPGFKNVWITDAAAPTPEGE